MVYAENIFAQKILTSLPPPETEQNLLTLMFQLKSHHAYLQPPKPKMYGINSSHNINLLN